MQKHWATLAIILGLWLPLGSAHTTEPSPTDPALAAKLGADSRGMRQYVLVILKSGSRRVPEGQERIDMFKGHFANMERLAKEQKLVAAGPFSNEENWRGMFIFAVPGISEAEALVATDPVIQSGEMVAEYHQLYASAALMALNEIHDKISPR